MASTSVTSTYGLELLRRDGRGGEACPTGYLDPAEGLGAMGVMPALDSIDAALAAHTFGSADAALSMHGIPWSLMAQLELDFDASEAGAFGTVFYGRDDEAMCFSPSATTFNTQKISPCLPSERSSSSASSFSPVSLVPQFVPHGPPSLSPSPASTEHPDNLQLLLSSFSQLKSFNQPQQSALDSCDSSPSKCISPLSSSSSPCVTPSKKTHSKQRTDRHIPASKKHHPGDILPQRIPCPWINCPKTFSSQAHLRRHKKIHENIRAYPCEVCGMHFSRSDTLKNHRVKIHRLF
ncbi:zf-C2H2 Zinc finger, C2H2 type [Chytriomyces hyalinus]|nr:zf-C2H2 Zinc finger, C2H2 type [Chytriomyces hyalinus]